MCNNSAPIMNILYLTDRKVYHLLLQPYLKHTQLSKANKLKTRELCDQYIPTETNSKLNVFLQVSVIQCRPSVI